MLLSISKEFSVMYFLRKRKRKVPFVPHSNYQCVEMLSLLQSPGIKKKTKLAEGWREVKCQVLFLGSQECNVFNLVRLLKMSILNLNMFHFMCVCADLNAY